MDDQLITMEGDWAEADMPFDKVRILCVDGKNPKTPVIYENCHGSAIPVSNIGVYGEDHPDIDTAGMRGKGPWQQYPKRMLSMRARTLAARDGAADALMGLQVAEEMQDVPVRDITPTEPDQPPRKNLAQQLKEAEQKPEAVEGEVLPPEDTEDAQESDNTEGFSAFPGSDEFTEGVKACQGEGKVADCPYDGGQQMADWLGGFMEAKKSEAT